MKWVLLYNCDKDLCIYADSYGEFPPFNIYKAMKKTHKECIDSQVDLQALNSSECGFWAIYIAMKLLDGEDLADIVTHHMTNQNGAQNKDYLDKWFVSKGLLPRR